MFRDVDRATGSVTRAVSRISLQAPEALVFRRREAGIPKHQLLRSREGAGLSCRVSLP